PAAIRPSAAISAISAAAKYDMVQRDSVAPITASFLVKVSDRDDRLPIRDPGDVPAAGRYCCVCRRLLPRLSGGYAALLRRFVTRPCYAALLRGLGEFADLDAPHCRTLLQVGPRELLRILGFELVIERLRIVVIDQHEG